MLSRPSTNQGAPMFRPPPVPDVVRHIPVQSPNPTKRIKGNVEAKKLSLYLNYDNY